MRTLRRQQRLRLWAENESLAVSCRDFLAYLHVVDAAPLQPAEGVPAGEISSAPVAVHLALLDELWRECCAQTWGLQRGEFDRIILLVSTAQNFGLPSGIVAQKEEQAAFFRSLKLADLLLAKACAAGNERAWEHFMAIYGQPLTRAAIAISGSETVGGDLADTFYAELYGLNTRDGERRCPLDSYRGRGSLLGWLRTTLAQRFVDHYRRTYRELAFDDQVHDVPVPNPVPDPEPAILAALRRAVHAALHQQPAEERFLLASYYVDDKTLADIGQILHVHEATISRRLRRATDAVRKQLIHNLEANGMTRRAAEEALGTDPRDLDLKMDLRKLLQSSEPEPFTVQEITNPATAQETIARAPLSDEAKTTR
jgi:RNA polymerase sigma-70 factor (ECF subfamily)